MPITASVHLDGVATNATWILRNVKATRAPTGAPALIPQQIPGLLMAHILASALLALPTGSVLITLSTLTIPSAVSWREATATWTSTSAAATPVRMAPHVMTRQTLPWFLSTLTHTRAHASAASLVGSVTTTSFQSSHLNARCEKEAIVVLMLTSVKAPRAATKPLVQILAMTVSPETPTMLLPLGLIANS